MERQLRELREREAREAEEQAAREEEARQHLEERQSRRKMQLEQVRHFFGASKSGFRTV